MSGQQTGSTLAGAPQTSIAAPARILVVDDDLSNRESLSRRLQRRGYFVETAVDGPDGLRQVDAGSFDLVLLDVMMPGMSGLDVLKCLRERYSATELPIIMATARDQSEDVVAALELGASDYVTKPLDFPVVVARIKTQLLLKQSVHQVLQLERRLKDRNAELESANAQLSAAAARTHEELRSASQVQVALLPSAAPAVAGVQCAWSFQPCQELAGDALNVFAIDAQNVGCYVLDVSGHGVAAALLAVAATRVLANAQDAMSVGGEAVPAQPLELAARLNRAFAWNDQIAQFLTLFYAVMHVPMRRLTYVSAGHPPAIRVTSDGRTSRLESTAMPVGVAEAMDQQQVQLEPGDRLYIYSDGLTETFNPRGEQLGIPRLTEMLSGMRGLPLSESVTRILSAADSWRGGVKATDDVSIVALEC